VIFTEIYSLLIESTTDRLTPRDLYAIYYLAYAFDMERSRLDAAERFEVGHEAKVFKEKYLKVFKDALLSQIRKYIGRGRTDIDISVVNAESSLVELQKAMSKTFRSDMQLRNERWDVLADLLVKLEAEDDGREIIFYLDRINNTVHNTGDVMLDKLENSAELLRTFNKIHRMESPTQLKRYAPPAIRRIKILGEAVKPFDPSDYNTEKGSHPVALVLGRFQPWTAGHNALFAQTQENNVVIGIVKGKKSSEDKERNPLDFETQKEVIEAMKNPRIKQVIAVESAFIPAVISQLRDDGLEVVEVLAGSDRVKGYQYMADRYNDQLNMNYKIKQLERDDKDVGTAGISATKVRNAIKNDNYDLASGMMVRLTPELFKKIQRQLR